MLERERLNGVLAGDPGEEAEKLMSTMRPQEKPEAVEEPPEPRKTRSFTIDYDKQPLSPSY